MASQYRLVFLAALALGASLSGCGGKVIADGSNGAGGSGGGSTSSSSSSSSSGSTDCGGLAEVACLGAFPACVPVYDDTCCSSCDPVGGCADCVNYRFHHCAEFAEACGPSSAPCGQVPSWACQGGKADCAIPPEGSQTPCATRPGCIPAYCSTDVVCKTDPICKPIHKDICTSSCDAIPPPCPAGTSAENDGFCFTGLCIPIDYCAIPL
ncbi:MAG: hypothetical protein U0359_04745 [Byssovorax sp.]